MSDLLGFCGVCVGASPSAVAVFGPYRVIVSVSGDPAAKEFGTLFRPPAGQLSSIDRVVVRGGRRLVAVDDPTRRLWSGPDSVEVFLRGARPQSFTGVAFLSVSGGTTLSIDVAKRNSAALRAASRAAVGAGWTLADRKVVYDAIECWRDAVSRQDKSAVFFKGPSDEEVAALWGEVLARDAEFKRRFGESAVDMYKMKVWTPGGVLAVRG